MGPPPGLVDLVAHVPGLHLDIRYATADNFTGAPLPGYDVPGAWATRAVAEALARVQAALRQDGLGLIVFDAYRPARAARAMAAWCRANHREDLLNGYISETTRHSRGVAVDVGLVDASETPLDMGSDFDEFTERAWVGHAEGEVLKRRRLLKERMEAEGFDGYRREWWHFEHRDPDAPVLDVPYG